MKQPITMIVACRDDEGQIADCLASCERFSEEVLVADLGCSDRSLEIASEHEQVRAIPFADVRHDDFLNWVASQAKSPWIMLLDADERLTPDLIDEIELELSRGARFDTYQVGRTTLVAGKRLNHGRFKRDHVGRLFRRGAASFEKIGSRFFLQPETGQSGSLQSRLLRQPNWQFDLALEKTIAAARLDAEWAVQHGKTASAFTLLASPALAFAKELFLRSGIRDGEPGIRTAWLLAIHAFCQHAVTRSQAEAASKKSAEQYEQPLEHQQRAA